MPQSPYAPNPTPENRATLDRAYAEAMGKVVRRFPQDLDAGALFAEALMVLSPWDHWTREGQPRPGTEEAAGVLESVLARNIKHPGACHLYIHLMEASPAPEQAEACADLLADQIPGASHIQHMPSHIYMHIARYGDAVRTNQNAWQIDQQAAHDQAIAIYPAHNYPAMSALGLLAESTRARPLDLSGEGRGGYSIPRSFPRIFNHPFLRGPAPI